MEWPTRLPPVGGGGVSKEAKIDSTTYTISSYFNKHNRVYFEYIV